MLMFEILLLKNFGFKNLNFNSFLNKINSKLITFKMRKGVILTVKKNKPFTLFPEIFNKLD